MANRSAAHSRPSSSSGRAPSPGASGRTETVVVATPAGPVRCDFIENDLVAVHLGATPPKKSGKSESSAKHLFAAELKEYFAGRLKKFRSRFSLLSGTDFQKKVWLELLNIPYGKVVSYGELAEMIGHPRAARAVGNALNKNPLPLILPCHRVVASGGKLGGFGGGVEMKKILLAVEGVDY